MRKLTALVLVLVLLCAATALADVKPYSKVYEPRTSAVLSAAVAWKHDGSALPGERTPGTAMVWLDAQLRVYAEDGALIDESLDNYIEATTGSVIPALYIRDAETASALKAYLEKSGLGDVFVVADCENAALVREVAQLLYVRGMVDFRRVEAPDEAMLDEIIRTTNASCAKVALLSEKAAVKENVQYLQRRLITVWAQCESAVKPLLTAYTAGVNGVLVSDCAAAYDALEFFADDAPTLLRVPNVIGHRGMPSVEVENTMESALSALKAGADSVEVDIYLSADGEIFINHDSDMERLFNRPDIADVEKLTLAELQQIPFSDDAVNGVQVENHTAAADSRYGEIRMHSDQRIPSLEAVYDAFGGSGVPVDTEIKSKNPEIVSALRALSEEKDNFGELFVITFNSAILDAMAERWSEMSVGALGTQGAKKKASQPYYMEYSNVISRKGVEKALEMLYGEIDRWNATFNPDKGFSYELAVAGRHRGLTVWPWTYNDPAEFADAYLKGIYGLTTNFAWWAGDFVTDVRAEDARIACGDEIPLPEAVTRLGENVQAGGAELIAIEGSVAQPGEALCIWRLKQALTIGGVSYGDYYLYSNPFTVTVEAGE